MNLLLRFQCEEISSKRSINAKGVTEGKKGGVKDEVMVMKTLST